MSAGLRRELAEILAIVLAGGVPLFGDNELVRADPLLANGPASGYLRFRFSLDSAGQPELLGRDDRLSGVLQLMLALPYGKGMAQADSILASLGAGLANHRFGALRFDGLAAGRGRQIGDFWIQDIDIPFTRWPEEAE